MNKLFVVIAILFGVSCPPALANNCTGFWANGFPDRPHRSVVPCQKFHPASASLSSEHEVYVVDPLADEPEIHTELETAARALQYSVDKYSEFGRVPEITLVRYDREYFLDPLTFAFTFVEFFDLDTESCPIIIYPHASTLTKEEFEQNIAHEVFHCVQKYNFKDQVSAAILALGTGKWWFEGIAQYFSNNVFPRNDYEYSARFPAPDQRVPFFDQPTPYSTENFWQGYANQVEPSVLFDAQSQMIAAPRALVASGLPQMAEALHQYGRDITRGKVRDDSGRYAPYSMPFLRQEAVVAETQDISIGFRDFTVGAHEIKLPRGHIWRLNVQNAPADAKFSIKKPGEEDYVDFTAVFQATAQCDEDYKVEIVATRTAPEIGDNVAIIRITSQENPECQCDHPDAEKRAALPVCAVGRWTVPLDVVQHSSKFTGSAAGTITSLNAFTYTLQINDDKTYSETLSYEHEASGPSVMTPGATMRMVQRVNAQSSGAVCKLSGDRLEFIGEQRIVQQLAMGENSGGRDTGLSENRTVREFYCGAGASDIEPPMPYPVNIDHLKARGFR